MLCELTNVPQHTGSPGYRRWFADDEVELIVWYSAAGEVSGFQLCYDLTGRERAFTWNLREGLTHAAVDSGEDSPLYNRSPMMVPAPIDSVENVLEEFTARAQMLAPELTAMVTARLSTVRRKPGME